MEKLKDYLTVVLYIQIIQIRKFYKISTNSFYFYSQLIVYN